MSLTEQPADTTSTLTGSTEDALNSLVDKHTDSKKCDPALATWIMEKVNRWRLSRNNNYGTDWEKYYRIWRGKWDPSLKGKLAERSRIITPATQSAIDQTVAEMAEAVFGRGMWFDLSEPKPPPQPAPPQGQAPQGPSPEDVERERDESIRDNLIDDFSNSRLVADVIETFYNGANYGTGISKRVQDKRLDGTKFISWAPVAPGNFVIDTAATTIDDALGCAHETIRPTHEIQEKIESGEYYKEDIGTSAAGFGTADLLKGGLTDFLEIDPQDGVYITEWHGKIPAKYLKDGPSDDEKDDIDLLVDETTEDDETDEDELVEAVVVIGNATHVLSAERNTLNDRGFVAYQHHRSPNSFWGIGVAEKAYNSQSGLDGEVRARQDALALTTYPIVGVDATRMPRNLNMVIAPGKVYMTNGRPSEVIEAITFGNLNNASFQQSGDMERYVQVATGAMDPAKPINGNSTPSAQSQQSSAFIKRAKLTMQSVDVDYLAPLIRKSIVAYNVLDPQRYPKLPSFTVNSTMSIMAREFEQMQMTNLLAIVPQESPAFPIILKGIIESYSGPSKDKIIAAIEETMKPDPAKQQAASAMQQAALEEAQEKVNKLRAEIKDITSRVGLNSSKSKQLDVKTQLAPVETQIQALNAGAAHKQAHAAHRAIEVDAAKAQLDHHHRNIEHVHTKVKNAIALRQAMQPPATGQGA